MFLLVCVLVLLQIKCSSRNQCVCDIVLDFARAVSVHHLRLYARWFFSAKVYIMCRVDQNHIYTVHIRYFLQGNHQIYGVYIRFWPTLIMCMCLWPTLHTTCSPYISGSDQSYLLNSLQHMWLWPALLSALDPYISSSGQSYLLYLLPTHMTMASLALRFTPCIYSSGKLYFHYFFHTHLALANPTHHNYSLHLRHWPT